MRRDDTGHTSAAVFQVAHIFRLCQQVFVCPKGQVRDAQDWGVRARLLTGVDEVGAVSVRKQTQAAALQRVAPVKLRQKLFFTDLRRFVVGQNGFCPGFFALTVVLLMNRNKNLLLPFAGGSERGRPPGSAFIRIHVHRIIS